MYPAVEINRQVGRRNENLMIHRNTHKFPVAIQLRRLNCRFKYYMYLPFLTIVGTNNAQESREVPLEASCFIRF